MGKHKGGNRPNSTAIVKCAGERISQLTSQLVDICCQQRASSQPAAPDLIRREHTEIRERVDEIRNLQRSVADSVLGPNGDRPSRRERIEIMSDWCRGSGCKANGVSTVAWDQDGEHFGLKAEKDLNVGELVISVPRRLFVSTENAFGRNEWMRKMFETDPLLKGMPNVALTFLVAVEKLKGADSLWGPYLDSLPSVYVTPLYFLVHSVAHLDSLRGSVALEETLKLYKNIARQYSYFYQLLSSAPHFVPPQLLSVLSPARFLFDLYLWAAVTVMTRINLVPAMDEQKERLPALIPYFDMANHGDVPPCTDFVGAAQCAVIYASKCYQAGGELLINYGERSYWELFVYNGFVYDDADQFPHVPVRLGLSNSDRLLKLKTEALGRFGTAASEQFIVRKHGCPVPTAMRQFARVFCSNESELRAFCSDQSQPDQFQWTDETTAAARKFLLTRLTLLLRAYAPTAVDERETGDDRPTELIVKFVRGEMDCLRSGVLFLESTQQ